MNTLQTVSTRIGLILVVPSIWETRFLASLLIMLSNDVNLLVNALGKEWILSMSRLNLWRSDQSQKASAGTMKLVLITVIYVYGGMIYIFNRSC